MPELPEVETIANGVHQRVQGDWIDSVWLGEKREPLKSPAALIASTLTGSRIEKVHRVGKTIVFDLEQECGEPGSERGKAAQFLVHLGMTGRLLVCQPEVPVPLHTHWIGTLRSGRQLRFVDARRFGRLSVHLPQKGGGNGADAAGETLGFQGTGREPLTISAAEFAALFRSRRTPIKAALLNQTLLHGVGNIYADESLFHAGIRPTRQAGRLTRAELARLHSELQAVLRNAISLGGSSVSDYVDAEGVRGFFQLEHRVYLRAGQPCLACGTPIKRLLVGGRGTHYCPACQR